MADWKFLNEHRVMRPTAGIPPQYISDESYGFNGLFRFTLDQRPIRCLASSGLHWEHCSVSIEGSKQTPPWGIMCKIKDLFWEPEQWVVQYHPARSTYVNHHPGCLHLWRPLKAILPTPDAFMVGPKT